MKISLNKTLFFVLFFVLLCLPVMASAEIRYSFFASVAGYGVNRDTLLLTSPNPEGVVGVYPFNNEYAGLDNAFVWQTFQDEDAYIFSQTFYNGGIGLDFPGNYTIRCNPTGNSVVFGFTINAKTPLMLDGQLVSSGNYNYSTEYTDPLLYPPPYYNHIECNGQPIVFDIQEPVQCTPATVATDCPAVSQKCVTVTKDPPPPGSDTHVVEAIETTSYICQNNTCVSETIVSEDCNRSEWVIPARYACGGTSYPPYTNPRTKLRLQRRGVCEEFDSGFAACHNILEYIPEGEECSGAYNNDTGARRCQGNSVYKKMDASEALCKLSDQSVPPICVGGTNWVIDHSCAQDKVVGTKCAKATPAPGCDLCTSAECREILMCDSQGIAVGILKGFCENAADAITRNCVGKCWVRQVTFRGPPQDYCTPCNDPALFAPQGHCEGINRPCNDIGVAGGSCGFDNARDPGQRALYCLPRPVILKNYTDASGNATSAAMCSTELQYSPPVPCPGAKTFTMPAGCCDLSITIGGCEESTPLGASCGGISVIPNCSRCDDGNNENPPGGGENPPGGGDTPSYPISWHSVCNCETSSCDFLPGAGDVDCIVFGDHCECPIDDGGLWHTVCDYTNKVCKTVEGPGDMNACVVFEKNCPPPTITPNDFHTVCNCSNLSCDVVAGEGTFECKTFANCSCPNGPQEPEDPSGLDTVCNCATRTCEPVVGTGNYACKNFNEDCNCPGDEPVPQPENFYSRCNTNSCQCEFVIGVGQNECGMFGTDCLDCQEPVDPILWHTVCDHTRKVCRSVAGAGLNECITYDIHCKELPTVGGLTSSAEGYCVGMDGAGVAYFRWQYNDVNGDTQSKFRLQISKTSDFTPEGGNVVFDRTLNGSASEQPVIVKIMPEDTCEYDTDGNPFGCGNYITYKTAYHWRVKVWDSSGADSGWQNYGGTYTYEYIHPAPTPLYYTEPDNPSPGDQVKFVDTSKCYDNNLMPYTCFQHLTSDSASDYYCSAASNKDGDPEGLKDCYEWAFGDGSTDANNKGVSYSYVNGYVNHIYKSARDYNSSLLICDNLGCCPTYELVEVRQGNATGAPEYQETTPLNK